MSAGSLTARLSLLFALSTAAVLFALGTTLEHAVDRHFRDMDRHDLTGKLALVREMVAAALDSAAGANLSAQLEAALVGHPGMTLQVRAADGTTVFARGGLPAGPDTTDTLHSVLSGAKPARRWLEWQQGERPFRGLRAPLRDGAAETGARTGSVLIGMDINHHQIFMDMFRRILTLSILAAASTAAVLGWAVTRTGLRPLRRITALAADLDTERLDARLPQAGVPAEINALVDAFNGMLARLEHSFRRLSDYSADVAHELRTPIGNLTLQTQVALQNSRDAAAYREVLYSSLEEYERLGRTINDMLYLAQADNGLLRPAAEAVDLGELVRALFDYFDAWAEEQEVKLVLAGKANAYGDPLMLRRALSNLLSNAIRHTGCGEQIRVRLGADTLRAHISVENPGPALPSVDLQRLFDRFYRGGPERNSGEREGGLGLAIVKAIVTAHGGEITVGSSAYGTRFDLTLPAVCGVSQRNDRRPSPQTDTGG